MNFVLGGTGRLGQALLREHGAGHAAAVPRAVYAGWGDSDAPAGIRAWFQQHAQAGDTVYVTCGLLDPSLPPTDHRRVNTLLPMHVATAAEGLGIQVVSFGTVLEQLVVQGPNAYVASKLELAQFAAASGSQLLHLRLHTLYGGGPPAPFMFLGLMLAALKAGRPFPMTPGAQLREYHHVQDEARAVRALCQQPRRGTLALSHGQPVTLRQLAEAVFSAAGQPGLLQVGALPGPAEDNYGSVFSVTPGLQAQAFRDALASVPADVASHL
jgi:nucleoside-diphosphate-sugar epimerase